MSANLRNILLFTAMGALLIAVGVVQSANVALAILNLCLISAIMTLGVNIQWGYAGLFNAGVMGFAALGGLTLKSYRLWTGLDWTGLNVTQWNILA